MESRGLRDLCMDVQECGQNYVSFPCKLDNVSLQGS
jgi:hypothetical protein